jgi:hypothetical protein
MKIFRKIKTTLEFWRMVAHGDIYTGKLYRISLITAWELACIEWDK